MYSHHYLQKVFLFMLCMFLFIMPALAEELNRPLLFVTLPEDATMIEDVQFDDGDFIQTYQLPESAHITLLRYSGFTMNAQELIDSEWEGATDVAFMNLANIDNFPTEAVRFQYSDPDSSTSLSVTILVVTAESDTLVFESVFPLSAGTDQINAKVDEMISSMKIINIGAADLG